MSARSTEFDGVFITTGGNRPLFSRPPRVRASRYLEDKIKSESPVPIPDDKAEDMADWIANLLDRYGAYHARMMFEMLPDGDGNPACSYCGSPHMFCGHGQMSGMPDNEEETEAGK